MIDAGTPVIDMDTLIAPLDSINVHSFLAPDNEFMGASVTQALVNAIDGEGNDRHDPGRARPHRRAGPRARASSRWSRSIPKIQVLDEQPADWDVTKVARIWETLLTKYPKINAAFFHNDDMALAASQRDEGEGPHRDHDRRRRRHAAGASARSGWRMHATVRNPSCRIHGGAIIAGVAAVVNGEKTGEGGIPKNIVTDGPVVTKANAPGMAWMEEQFLI